MPRGLLLVSAGTDGLDPVVCTHRLAHWEGLGLECRVARSSSGEMRIVRRTHGGVELMEGIAKVLLAAEYLTGLRRGSWGALGAACDEMMLLRDARLARAALLGKASVRRQFPATLAARHAPWPVPHSMTSRSPRPRR